MDFPFDWDAWRRFYAALPGSRREAAFRATLARVSGWGWVRDDMAPLPHDVIVVVGHQRSGTTWLHRMLASAPDATAMPLHALLLPADTWQRRMRGRPRWLDRLQDRIFGGMDPIHRIRLHEPEEDEFLLWGLFRSPMNALDRPWPPGRAPTIDGDDVALAFWAQAVARAARRTGRRYVGKNPHFTHRLAGLRAALPGVRTVRLVRDPREAIPSRLSLVRAIWARRGLPFPAHEIERIYANSVRCYRAEGEDLVVPYADLVADPQGVVRRVHEAFGLPVDERWLAGLGVGQRAGGLRHRYSLAEFGLSEARLAADGLI